MKSVLISIQPQWCEKIASGEKTIEVRKSAPKEVPFKAYIYCTKAKSQWRYSDYEGAYENSKGEIVYAQQHVISEFICDKVDEYKYDYGCGYYVGDGVDIDDDTILETAIDREDINIYAKGKTLYGWHISDLKIYDKPKKLGEFMRPCSYRGFCFSCDRATFAENGDIVCKKEITRPPQSYMFVEEI